MSASRSYSFGEYTLDLARGALLRSGADVKLRPKSFEVLRVLVERHGRLVTKEELLDAVWGRTVVTEGSIVQCLIDVRRAIGDALTRPSASTSAGVGRACRVSVCVAWGAGSCRGKATGEGQARTDVRV